ncbi:hypothetical protein C7C46_12340 [Streptomyces tateyamensis]|uniref:Uncharacterized protein n=1 Tax=Streptomyces tateyamensis TaxID=565073 RepID=A0A2V4P6Y1_9ACTN|nr:hypothetical protein [Streptomyces tateyamensis]PYC80488.1 hypothetical protein C7C46_12340 [Streptomyces tateyamensis]
MDITIALPVLLGISSAVLIWAKRVGPIAALLLFLAGFETAGTGLSHPVNQLLAAVIHALNHH